MKQLSSIIILLTLIHTTPAYVADSMHNAISSDVNELRAYLIAAGIEVPASDEELKTMDTDSDGLNDFAEWVMGTDPLHGEPQMQTSFSPPAPQQGMVIEMQLPSYFDSYAEIFCNNNLIFGSWEIAEGWIPTYGQAELTWQDLYRPNQSTFFYMIFDATLDLDGDGYSDYREHYITKTDPTTYNEVNTDGDWMHDWWERKLFGNLDQDGEMDYDGDTLLNNQELVWLVDHTIRIYSDPTLYDSDNDQLNDAQENHHFTDAMQADTDGDTLNDFVELFVHRTDPNNPDTQAPLIASN